MNSATKMTVTLSGLALAAGSLAGCTINIGAPNQGDGMMNNSQENSAGFSPRDLMFADMMIPHHNQAVEMSDLAAERSQNPELLALAKEIKSAQEKEVTQMQSWLDESEGEGGMGGMDHSGHGGGIDDMGGMLTPEEMQALENTSGAEFDRLWLTGMIEHHEGAIQMARMVTNSANAEVEKLGNDIVKTQKAEIQQMKELLAALGS